MRTDAKIGFAIVGVLVAVLAVYAVVIPKHKRLADTAKPVVIPPTPGPTEPATAPPTVPPTGDPVGPAGNPDPDGGSIPANPVPPGRPVEPNGLRSAVSTGHDGTGPSLLGGDPIRTPTEPPAVPGPVAANPPRRGPAAPADSGPERSGVHGRRGSRPSDDVASPATAAANDHPYTVRSGQTLSSIAAEIYGDSRAWTQIAKENPKINPARLKVGTRIMIPDPAAVRPHPGVVIPAADVVVSDEADLAAAVAPGQATYRVQSGDSLYKIAKRLLGSGRQADALYALNRGAIGPDMARLKRGMLLRLPTADSTLSADISR